MRRKLVGTLFAILGLMLWAGAAPAATLAGTVVAVSGSCTAHGRALKSRRCGAGQRYGRSSRTGSNLKLQMTDGSVISVAPGSSMTVTSYNVGGAGRQCEALVDAGVLRAVVAPVGGPSTFEVATAVGTASVRSGSADWFIVAQAGSAQVGVLAGTVDLTSAATGRSVSIPAHWGTRLRGGLDPMLPRLWAQMEFDAVIAGSHRMLPICPTKVGDSAFADRWRRYLRVLCPWVDAYIRRPQDQHDLGRDLPL